MAALLRLTIYSQMAGSVNIRRNTPDAAILSNLYDFINDTIQDSEAYYTEEETEKLKKDKNTIIVERGNK